MSKKIKVCCPEMEEQLADSGDGDGIMLGDHDIPEVNYENWYGFKLVFCPFCGKKIEVVEAKKK